ncbi:DUF1768-domain-containing protein [Stereum hirsutum FP-91666 SS1]|uniref:DUF1768-domain-containing protein n=1 Tax=Stereum hirsutum (strain FP-91666) TaxID=721885 RepID=UPI0004449EDD|nr:DUF1768-domain-containing protein [Stereum hirsutum FP-91666 SS1]EIM82303.1 DUF1768-domain-containing protein [Stereum hirsutum FP-91666 SS1]
MAAVEDIDVEAPTTPASQAMATQGQQGQPQNWSTAKSCNYCGQKPRYVDPQTKQEHQYCGQKCSEADQARRASQAKPLPQVQHKRPLSAQEDKPGMMDTLREKFGSSGPKRDNKPKTRADEKAQWVTSPAFKEPEIEMCEVCGRRPKYKDEKRNITHPYCGKTCADAQAKASGLAQAPSSAPQSAVNPKPDNESNANPASSSSTSSTPTSRFSPDGDPTTPNSTNQRAILFYHQGAPYYGFTNFSAHPIEYLNRVYPTSEHLFQALKFMKNDPDIAEAIRKCKTPRDAFDEAHRSQSKVRGDWFDVNIKKMEKVLSLKFQQHPSLRKELLETGDALLVEDSDMDSFWGIGANRQGKNELGRCLMRLRDSIRASLAEG